MGRACPGVGSDPARQDRPRPGGRNDFERIALTIRLALALPELGRPLPAFDLALKRSPRRSRGGQMALTVAVLGREAGGASVDVHVCAPL
ncbi:hypothetical protein ABT144_14050 [Streptomyces sp. NPDC002039]|uniref:hypothetical protein n=1 Tax=Streptomyces sp. NPDC002039 TaxID=3154660 RepID=UPI0033307667